MKEKGNMPPSSEKGMPEAIESNLQSTENTAANSTTEKSNEIQQLNSAEPKKTENKDEKITTEQNSADSSPETRPFDSIGAHVAISDYVELVSSPAELVEKKPDPASGTTPESSEEWHARRRKEDPTKAYLYEIIFESETRAGRLFDIALLFAILVSVLVVMLDSVESINSRFAVFLYTMEWIVTVLFTLEYGLRLYCSPNRKSYALSFFGIIDLLAIIPSYIEYFIHGGHYLLVIRVMRLLRLFRILKLGRFLHEAEHLSRGIKSSTPKIVVFLFAVLSCTTIVGAIMYLVEGEENGFTSIPQSVYWAIVTLTTVGYGDISPKTPLGQILACTVMILGYGVIAVPTGIVTVEMHKASRKLIESLACSNCGAKNHQDDSRYCRKCGSKLTLIRYVT